MRGIHLDPLLNSFFANVFPGFKTKFGIPDNLLTTPVPFVELPLGIDTEKLLELAKSIELDNMVRKSYPHEDYPRYDNWKIKLLWAEDFESTLLEDIYYQKKAKPVSGVTAVGSSEQIKFHLKSIGIDVNYCVLSMFGDNGYLRPHRDIGLNPTPLNYFWLPLTDNPGSELKIYPYGTVDVTLGNLYLLNQENFVHAVINRDNMNRYVLVGHFTTMSENFEQILAESILKRYAVNLT